MNVSTLSQNTPNSMSYSTKIMADATGVTYVRMINKAGTQLSVPRSWRKEVTSDVFDVSFARRAVA
jgi:hypothetical protein